MAYEFITVETAERVTTITFNRPEVMNALHPPAHRELGKAFDAFQADDAAWVAIITGAGEKAFCAGYDLKAAASGESIPDLRATGGFGGLTERYDLFKPVIAAVNGIAMGGGFEMALASDFIIASDNAVFALPEPRVGLIAGAGGLQRLPRMIPFKYAMAMILTSRRITAEEARHIGLVWEITAPDKLLETARKWAAEIVQGAPLAIQLSKQVALENFHLSMPDAMDRKTSLFETFFHSEDRREGPVAFAEKRKPTWKGR